MLTSFRRIIGLGWQNLVRDSGIAVGNVFIMIIPILLASSLFLVKDISAYIVTMLQDKADVSVYFNEDASEDDIMQIKEKISIIPDVKEVNYVSKEEALESFTERHQGDPTLLDSLEEVNGNPFLASLNVTAISSGQYGQMENLLGGDDFKAMVNKVNYTEKKDVIDKIFSITGGVTRAGLILFAILGALSLLVTFNTIRVAIINRGEEIEIQRLVGASRWFISGQFLVEGLILGILAAAFSVIIVAAVCWYASPALASMMPGLELWENFMAGIGALVGIELAVGAALGMLSSMVAVSRYLKV